MLRRTEDRIRNLCEELVAASDPEQQISIVAKLREELHRHVEQMSIRLGEYPIEERPRTGIHIVRPEIPETVDDNANSLRIVVIKGDRCRSNTNSSKEETTESANGKPKK